MTRADDERPWARHYQDAWHEDALNPNYPKALRVAFLAYGTHKANGHARFKPHEIATVLGAGRFDEYGHPVKADRRTVTRAIRQAVELGLLTEGSKAACLIVPRHRVTGGLGNENEPCTLGEHKSRPPRRQTLRVVS